MPGASSLICAACDALAVWVLVGTGVGDWVLACDRHHAPSDPRLHVHLSEPQPDEHAGHCAFRSRVNHGLPPRVEDPATLHRIAVLLEARAESKRPRRTEATHRSGDRIPATTRTPS